MAYMIPDAVPPGRPMSERRVFATLQGLPDDCWVYYEPLVTNRYPDFVVFVPDRGLLVIEVKGWHPSTVLDGDLQTIRLQDRTDKNPIRQAREYMVTLMDRCKHHRLRDLLVHSTGPNRGKFFFPFGYFALLSEITDDQLRTHRSGDLRQILPPDHVVAADEFDGWGRLSGQALRDRLGSFFDPCWPFALSRDQIDAVRAVVHPEIVLPPTPSQLALRAAEQLSLSDQEEQSPTRLLKSMDFAQERFARTILAGHRLLFGVAGSGKTVVLIARAKLLSEALPNGNILVLCFNVAFKSYLASALEGSPNIRVSTFHGWGAQNGVRWNAELPEDYGRRLLDALESGAGPDAGAFDAILIDEAQDFDPSWFRCVTRAMKEPRNGDLLIVGDGNQTTYRLGRISWKSLGVNAVGRGRSTILKQNYRNTRPIQAVAASFSQNSGTSDEIAATACEPTSAWRDSSILPVLFGRSSRGGELDAIHATVEGLLAGRFLGNEFPPLQPSEIGILYRKAQGNGLMESLRDRLASMAPVIWLNEPRQGADNRQRVLEPGIKLQTIHSAKGLQYRAVVLAFADQLGSGANDVLQEERRLLYVAVTRSEEVLVVTCTAPEGEPIAPILGELLNSGAFRQG
jgi:hypothetical protein